MSEAPLAERARAKVNLTLHVLGRRPDGYHVLDSLVAFAAVADGLTLDPGLPLAIEVVGPTARDAGADDDNLVLRATRALASLVPGLATGLFRLRKRLPVAAGLGGGSSDAAAALRLLARLNGIGPDDARLQEAARMTGSDVPVCLDGRTRWMRGAGEILSPPVALPRLPALLVNPRVPASTPDVFRALGLTAGPLAATAGPGAIAAATRTGLVAALGCHRNDLEAPAMAVAPAIRQALDAVRDSPDCRLARMSGSGATVFGLFDTCRHAAAAAKAIRARQPGWWVSATMIG